MSNSGNPSPQKKLRTGPAGFCTAGELALELAAADAVAAADAAVAAYQKENNAPDANADAGSTANADDLNLQAELERLREENAALKRQIAESSSSTTSASVRGTANAVSVPLPVPPAVDYSAYNNLPLDTSFQISLTLRGTHFYKAKSANGTGVVLRRQPENEHDSNAIRVCLVVAASDANTSTTCTGKVATDDNDANEEEEEADQTIGHIAKEQAILLAPLLDSGSIEFTTVT